MLLAFAALLTASLSSPDLILPGHHGVTHELVVETAPDVEDWRLFAAPTAGFGGLHEVVDGDPGLGQGVADPTSTIAALRMAWEMAGQRGTR